MFEECTQKRKHNFNDFGLLNWAFIAHHHFSREFVQLIIDLNDLGAYLCYGKLFSCME